MGKPTLRQIACATCLRIFPGGPRALYCPDCRKERRREGSRRHKDNRRNGQIRPLGSADNCTVCGTLYTVTGPNQRYCPECSRCAVMDVDAEQGLAYYRKHKDAINPERRARRRKETGGCRICGVTFALDGKPRRYCCDDHRLAGKRERQRRADLKRRGRDKASPQ